MKKLKRYLNFFLLFLIGSTILYGEEQKNVVGGVQLLYWNAKVDRPAFVGLADSLLIHHLDAPKDVDTIIDAQRLDFTWNCGIKGYLTYIGNCEEDWQYGFEGSYLYNESDKFVLFDPSLTEDQLIFLIPLVNPALAGNFVGSAQAAWQFKFSTLDLVASKQIFKTTSFIFTPHFGVRMAIIQQEYQVDYFDTVYLTETGNLNADRAFSTMQSRYHAIGIRIGSEFLIPICSGLNVKGNVIGSLVYGRTEIEGDVSGFNLETDPEGLAVLTTLDLHSTNKIYQLSANFESELGLLYSFCWGYCQLDISCTYFFGIWFDQDRFNQFILTKSHDNDTQNNSSFPIFLHEPGHLQLHGLSLGLSILF